MIRLAAIIPVMNWTIFKPLFKQIVNNSVIPELTVIIDNTKEGIQEKLARITPLKAYNMIAVWRPDKPPVPTNPSWAQGFNIVNQFSQQRGSVDIVSVLNDDIAIGRDFFKRVKKVLAAHNEAAVVCPYTITAKNKGKDKPEKLGRMVRREGWAFSIRKKILDNCPPFPEGCNYFYGDNWLWWACYRAFEKVWLKDPENVIYHHVGKSIIDLPDREGIIKREKLKCETAIEKTFLVKTELTEA